MDQIHFYSDLVDPPVQKKNFVLYKLEPLQVIQLTEKLVGLTWMYKEKLLYNDTSTRLFGASAQWI